MSMAADRHGAGAAARAFVLSATRRWGGGGGEKERETSLGIAWALDTQRPPPVTLLFNKATPPSPSQMVPPTGH